MGGALIRLVVDSDGGRGDGAHATSLFVFVAYVFAIVVCHDLSVFRR